LAGEKAKFLMATLSVATAFETPPLPAWAAMAMPPRPVPGSRFPSTESHSREHDRSGRDDTPPTVNRTDF